MGEEWENVEVGGILGRCESAQVSVWRSRCL